MVFNFSTVFVVLFNKIQFVDRKYEVLNWIYDGLRHTPGPRDKCTTRRQAKLKTV
jgi:hypothetical protein